jgi:hypothetical protein
MLIGSKEYEYNYKFIMFHIHSVVCGLWFGIFYGYRFGDLLGRNNLYEAFNGRIEEKINTSAV